ncbi:MAG: hypothetical protein ABEK59_12510 [Halobacteria archaeon]
MEQRFGNLDPHLLSLTDMFLFKSVTSREGDLEDAALIARQGDVDWTQVLGEVEKQEELSDTYFSFSVLDTLDLLVERYGIEVPIRDKLASYCLRHGLLLTPDEWKTIDDLREDLEFPDHRIYNKLRKLENEDNGRSRSQRKAERVPGLRFINNLSKKYTGKPNTFNIHN